MEYAENCIHLKACRRMMKIGNFKHGRGCNSETCTAYDNSHVYTEEDCEKVLYGVINDVQNGYTDLLVSDYV